MGCFHKALPNVKSAYVTLQNFTPDLQKIYTDISAVSVTLCNSGTGSWGLRGMGLGLPGSSDSPSALSGWRAGLPWQHIAAACAPRSSRCQSGRGPGEPGTAVLSGEGWEPSWGPSWCWNAMLAL